MVERIEVQPQMFAWARARARLDVDDLIRRFPRLPDWEAGQAQPTLRQLEDFAAATHAPLGYLLLDEPPVEPVPIPDFRIHSVSVTAGQVPFGECPVIEHSRTTGRRTGLCRAASATTSGLPRDGPSPGFGSAGSRSLTPTAGCFGRGRSSISSRPTTRIRTHR